MARAQLDGRARCRRTESPPPLRSWAAPSSHRGRRRRILRRRCRIIEKGASSVVPQAGEAHRRRRLRGACPAARFVGSAIFVDDVVCLRVPCKWRRNPNSAAQPVTTTLGNDGQQRLQTRWKHTAAWSELQTPTTPGAAVFRKLAWPSDEESTKSPPPGPATPTDHARAKPGHLVAAPMVLCVRSPCMLRRTGIRALDGGVRLPFPAGDGIISSPATRTCDTLGSDDQQQGAYLDRRGFRGGW